MMRLSLASSAAIALLMILLAPVSGQESDYSAWSTADLYRYATGLLKKGRTFQTAIDVLSEAIKREPGNVDYRLALGCAFADRFAAVARARRQALSLERDRSNYDFQRKEWEKAQSQPGHLAHGGPPPQSPPDPTTPDDDAPFTLSPRESLRLLRDIGHSAVEAFGEARKLAQDRPAKERAETEFVRGWGLFLLRDAAPDVVMDRPASPNGGDLCIPAEDVRDAFRACTQADPGEPAYWQSLGVAWVPRDLLIGDLGNWADFMDGREIHKPQEVSAAIAAYRSALERRPASFDLLYQLALIALPTDPPLAADSLEKATKRPGSNATIWYLLADLRFRKAEQQKGSAAWDSRRKAMRAVREGNGADVYENIPFRLPAPSLLAIPWEYKRSFALDLDGLVQQDLLTGDLRLCLSEHLKAGRSAEAVDVALLMEALGRRLMATVRRPDLFFRGPLVRARLKWRAMAGVLNCTEAYRLIQKEQDEHPDEIKARYLADQADAYQEWRRLDRQLGELY